MDFLFPLLSVAFLVWFAWYGATDGPRAKRREQLRNERDKCEFMRICMQAGWTRDYALLCWNQTVARINAR